MGPSHSSKCTERGSPVISPLQQEPLSGPSGSSSETSPSKHIRQAEAVTPTGSVRKRTDDAVQWFNSLPKTLENIIPRYTSAIQDAMQIFRDTGSTGKRDYEILENHVLNSEELWRQFRRADTISVKFLRTSVIYFKFSGIIKYMKTPRNVPSEYAPRMAAYRAQARKIAIEAEVLRLSIEEFEAWRRELKGGTHVGLLPKLPDPESYDRIIASSEPEIGTTVDRAFSELTFGPNLPASKVDKAHEPEDVLGEEQEQVLEGEIVQEFA